MPTARLILRVSCNIIEDMTNIHIGNLSFNTTEEGLRLAFEKFGTVEETRIITDKTTGKSKGFGFVEMADEKQGEKAIKEMDGKMLDGRKIRVSKALAKEQRNDGWQNR